MTTQPGDLITVVYENRDFEVIVIDPDGLGPELPSVGFGFRQAARYLGIPQQTLTSRVTELDGVEHLKNPSGKAFRVTELLGEDRNIYKVIEVSLWFELALDTLINPGQTRKATKENIGAFVSWFAVKGFYAEAYTAFKGTYSQKDSRATSRWLRQRESGKAARKTCTDLLSDLGVHNTARCKRG